MPNLRKENRELLQLLEAIRNDLVMRSSETDDDGTKVVDLSSGLWIRLHDCLNQRNTLGVRGQADPIGKLPEHHKQWFAQLKKAAQMGDLALMSCLDAKTMEPRSVLTLVSQDSTGFIMTPVGHFSPEDNPYEAYLPPRTEQETIR